MKDNYVGLTAEKVDFGSYDIATNSSLPSGCIQIVADLVDPGANKCKNPSDTTQYMYINKDEFSGQTFDADLMC